MKYRIIELNNGSFEIQRKRSWCSGWEYIEGFISYELAKKELIKIKGFNKNRKEYEEGMKIKRVVEEAGDV